MEFTVLHWTQLSFCINQFLSKQERIGPMHHSRELLNTLTFKLIFIDVEAEICHVLGKLSLEILKLHIVWYLSLLSESVDMHISGAQNFRE